MKKIIIILSMMSLLFLGSCEQLFMTLNPETNNTAIFEEYWKLVSEKFAMFDVPGKNLNREKLYNETRPLVTDSMSTLDLFSVLSRVTLQLMDGHSFLIDEKGRYGAIYDFESGYPRNLDQEIVDSVYLSGNVKSCGKGLKYTFLKGGAVGYIQYRDFDKEVAEKMMNTILNYFRDAKGIILDVRGNYGGDPGYAALIASHFTNSKVYAGYERFKTGPEINDFSSSKIYLTPASGIIYSGPVMVLTNIQCFSATTTLIYLLNPLPNVTFIGGRTGGGSGSTADGYLANGWHWGLSTSEFIDWEGRHLDNGFDPDIHTDLDTNDRTKDEIIEKAVNEILSRG